MKRREALKAGATAGLGLLAGCAGTGDGTTTTTTATTEPTTTTATTSRGLSGQLDVATYSSFVDDPGATTGVWIKEQFEKAHPDVTINYLTPSSEINYFIQRKKMGVAIDADVYVGLNPFKLVRAANELGDVALFDPVADELDNVDHVLDDLWFDPQNRVVPYDTGYISLVYDGTDVEGPATFDELATPHYASRLLAQNAQTSATGKAFLLWSIHTVGPENYLDYWQRLVENGARILKDWWAAYSAFPEQRPIVVSYSNDRVYAHRAGKNLEKHKIGFLNDQGYANPQGMARFADAENPELAARFLDFLLSKRVQSKIPVLNVQFPATDWAEPPASFTKYARRPPEPVTYSYDQLKGTLQPWIQQWAKRIATN